MLLERVAGRHKLPPSRRIEVVMSPWLMLHQLSMAFVAGGFLALVAALSLLLRSVDDAERNHQARLVVAIARFVTPFMDQLFHMGPDLPAIVNAYVIVKNEPWI